MNQEGRKSNGNCSTVGEAYMAIFWPPPGSKGRTLVTSGFSTAPAGLHSRWWGEDNSKEGKRRYGGTPFSRPTCFKNEAKNGLERGLILRVNMPVNRKGRFQKKKKWSWKRSGLSSGWPLISLIRVCLIISLIRVAFHLSHQGGLSSLTSGCVSSLSSGWPFISLIRVAFHLSHQGGLSSLTSGCVSSLSSGWPFISLFGVASHLLHQGVSSLTSGCVWSSLTSGWSLTFHIRVCLIISFIRVASQLSHQGVSHLSHQGGLSSLSPSLSSLFFYNSYENLLRKDTNEESVKLPFEGGCFVTTRLPDMTSSVDWGSSHESHMTTAQWVCPDAANNTTVATVKRFGLISRDEVPIKCS